MLFTLFATLGGLALLAFLIESLLDNYTKELQMTINQHCIEYGVETNQSLLVKAQMLISLHKMSADYIKAIYNIEINKEKEF